MDPLTTEHRAALTAITEWLRSRTCSRPVLRVNPPAAFASIREAAKATGHTEPSISRAVSWQKPLAGEVWTECPLLLLWKMRADLFVRGWRRPRKRAA